MGQRVPSAPSPSLHASHVPPAGPSFSCVSYFPQPSLEPIEQNRSLLRSRMRLLERRIAAAADYFAETMSAHADELAGIATEADVAVAAAAEAPIIFSTARYEYVDLIVMCSHGKTGLKCWVFGSVAQEAVRHSPVPVLVLNEHGMVPSAPDATHPLRVLVALDGSALAETALEPAAQLIAALGPSAQSEVQLLGVVDLPSAYGKLKSEAYISDSMQEEARKEAEKYVKAVAD